MLPRSLAPLSLLLVLITAASAPSAVLNLGLVSDGFGVQLDGSEPFHDVGFSVSEAGDVNGDGFDDFLISDLGIGVYVLYGDGSLPPENPATLSFVNGENGYLIVGNSFAGGVGFSTSGAGDFNGDGLDDILIGAPGEGDGGIVYLIYGAKESPGFEGIFELFNLTSAEGIVFLAAEPSSSLGVSVAGAGDVNSDGLSDILLGAPGADPEGIENGGAAFLIAGRTDAPAVIDLAIVDAANMIQFTGRHVEENIGLSVDGAGDVNADGIDDIIIGPVKGFGGQASVIFGARDWAALEGVVRLRHLTRFHSLRIRPREADAMSPQFVAGAGDVDGDGSSDVLIGNWAASPGDPSGAGEAYLVFGQSADASDGIVRITELNGSNGVQFNGIDAGDQAGLAISSAGDVNGDGLDDVLIGAPAADGGTGEATLIHGTAALRNLGGVLELGDLPVDHLLLTGAAPLDFAAFAVSGAQDVNRDGVEDFLISAPEADAGGVPDSGATYLLIGDADVPSATRVRTTRAEDAPPTDFGPVVRAVADFTDGTRATTIVTVFRDEPPVPVLGPANLFADVHWLATTTRTFWDQVDLTFQYTDREILGLNESTLTLLRAHTLAGPWIAVDCQLDTARNEISGRLFGDTAGTQFFALRANP